MAGNTKEDPRYIGKTLAILGRLVLVIGDSASSHSVSTVFLLCL